MNTPSILEQILTTKQEEIETGSAWVSMDELKARSADMPPLRGFEQALRQAAGQGSAVIAEIKKASPSAGVIRAEFDVGAIARSYESAGAACLSVLTDEPYFQGHRDHLMQAREACSLPLLRKDFIVDPWQVYESVCLGADCILLIVAALRTGQLEELYGLAVEAGLDVLVEVHDEAELEVAGRLGSHILGVNNRNLRTFATDLGASEHLKSRISREQLMVSESGIRTPADVARLQNAGIHAFLVGEALMKQPDIGLALQSLRRTS